MAYNLQTNQMDWAALQARTPLRRDEQREKNEEAARIVRDWPVDVGSKMYLVVTGYVAAATGGIDEVFNNAAMAGPVAQLCVSIGESAQGMGAGALYQVMLDCFPDNQQWFKRIVRELMTIAAEQGMIPEQFKGAAGQILG
jgi:hypothetical protein